MEAFGIHCICELHGCPPELLNDIEFVKQSIRDAANQGMATLLGEVSHKFHPQGVTALGLIAESHLAIHTWPECGYVALDVFTCGERASAVKACEYLIGVFKASDHVMRRLDRGLNVPVDAGSQPRDPVESESATLGSV